MTRQAETVIDAEFQQITPARKPWRMIDLRWALTIARLAMIGVAGVLGVIYSLFAVAHGG